MLVPSSPSRKLQLLKIEQSMQGGNPSNLFLLLGTGDNIPCRIGSSAIQSGRTDAAGYGGHVTGQLYSTLGN